MTTEAARVHKLWLAGAPLDGIARALRMRPGVVAVHLSALDDADLLAGLRAHLAAVVDSDPLTRARGQS